MSGRNSFRFKVSLRAEDLRDSINPSCKVSLLTYKGELQGRLHRTATAYQTESPVWENKFSMPVSFGETSRLRFEVFDNESAAARVIGVVEMPCASLIRFEETKLELLPQGFLYVQSEIHPQANEFLYLQFSARQLKEMDMVGENDPFYVLSVIENGQPRKLYTSEALSDTPNPRWRGKVFSLSDLRNEEGDKEILIEVYDEDNVSNDFIGGKMTILSELTVPGKELVLKDKRDRTTGVLSVEAGTVISGIDFITRLRAGLQISLMFGVDFGRSLSKFHTQGSENIFLEALRAIGAALCTYDSDQRMSIFGFGGQPPEVTDGIWDLGEGEVTGVSGLMNAYQNSLVSSPVYKDRKTLHELLERIHAELEVLGRTSAYYILVLLTDGRVEDLEECKALLVKLSRLPLSVVIVGMGQSSLKDMAVLDSDTQLLEAGGEISLRDIVQFGTYRQGQDPRLLALELVSELPQQVTDYFLLTS